MPKHYEINRHEIKADILYSKLNQKTISNNPYHYSFSDYEVTTSKTLNLLRSYINENLKIKYNLTLSPRLSFGNIFEPKQQSFFRNLIDPLNINDSSDYVMIYGVDLDRDASIVIEKIGKKGIKELVTFKINNNNFLLFPSHLKFFINENTSFQDNVFLSTTYVEI